MVCDSLFVYVFVIVSQVGDISFHKIWVGSGPTCTDTNITSGTENYTPMNLEVKNVPLLL